MRIIKHRFLTAKEIEKFVQEGKDIPTAIFSAKKKDYIVKPRGTVFGIEKKKRKGRIKW